MFRMNRQKTDFLKKLSEYFETLPFTVNEKGICVCLSGGADSVSLLFGLRELQQKFGYRLYACHFNHMIRGEEADRDEMFCKNLCRGLIELRHTAITKARIVEIGTVRTQRSIVFFKQVMNPLYSITF